MSPINKTGIEYRKRRILDELRQAIEEMSGLSLSPSDDSISFFSLGLDSLFLTQFVGHLKKTFEVSLSFRQILEEYTDISSLGDYLDRELPNDFFQDIPSQHAEPVPFHSGATITQEISIRATVLSGQDAGVSANETLEKVVREQIQVMKTQLDILQNIPRRAPRTSQDDEQDPADSFKKQPLLLISRNR